MEFVWFQYLPWWWDGFIINIPGLYEACGVLEVDMVLCING